LIVSCEDRVVEFSVDVDRGRYVLGSGAAEIDLANDMGFEWWF